MYQAFYKLHGKPFQLTPDAAMLFPSKGHKRAMAYLLYGLEQSEGFVMITGAVGTGKTLLIKKLLEEVAHRNIAVANVASANLGEADILPAVASAFELAYEGRSKESLLQNLKQHLTDMRSRHAHALLIVDEAQTLEPSALEMLRILSNLEVEGRALLQIFLVGQSELRSIIINNRMEQLRQRVIASYCMEPLGEAESLAYIMHRLHAVGWNHDPELASGTFASVFRASNGVPRRINLIMDRLLLHGFLEELHELDAKAVATVMEEIRDEMPDMPVTLEASTLQDDKRPAHDSPSAKSSSRHETVVTDASNILLRLMRETIRIRKALRTRQATETNTDGATVGDAQFPHPVRTGRDDT